MYPWPNVSRCTTGTLGPALGIASSEISGKVTLMQERFDQLQARIDAKEIEPIELAGTLYEPSLTLQFIVVEEVGTRHRVVVSPLSADELVTVWRVHTGRTLTTLASRMCVCVMR